MGKPASGVEALLLLKKNHDPTPALPLSLLLFFQNLG